MNPSPLLLMPLAAAAILAAPDAQAEQEPVPLYAESFSPTAYGRIPAGWRDLIDLRPSRNWAVDGRGCLRPVLKNRTGLLIYDGYTSEPKRASVLADARIVAEFKKTEDESVSFGLAGRVRDRGHYYLARFSGTRRLELLLVQDGVETALDAVPVPGLEARRPTGAIALRPYREGERWSLALTMEGDLLAASLRDPEGLEQARLAARNGALERGSAGLCATAFAAASAFRLESLTPFEAKADPARLAKRNAILAAASPDYPVVGPFWETTELDTPPGRVAADYDVVIAGAGTGGWAAAIQAARMGSRVLLLEETDWIGGQMCAAGVTTMDEDSGWMKFPVRERGLYREFHESIGLYYHTRDKDPLVAYYGWPEQVEGGYEPKAARAVLQGFIHEARDRGATLDLLRRARVTAVRKTGVAVTGATIDLPGGVRREVACRVLIDATEYGDVIPLTGARYRVGNGASDRPDPAALVQDYTWTALVREYPGGVPEHLQIKTPPPGYETGPGKRFRKFTGDGFVLWGGAGKGVKGSRHWSVYFAWRGMADADSPLTGLASGLRHTQCGFNGGNDYPVTAATIEDPARRRLDEREGIHKTLGTLYYFQRVLGVNWSLAEDEGYATAANREKMKSLGLRPDLEALAIHLPQHPYVRECRRIVGVQTLTGHDLGRYENARHVATAVAMGDYFMDLDHGDTAHAIEPELDAGELPAGGGPFQIPFEVFLPETVDGFLPAEKNLSQSRLANGATRLQPVTMLTGQAAGAIAALAAREGLPPRALDPRTVQIALLDAGCTLIQRWYADVPWGTEIWRATQLLSLHHILDRPGPIDQDNAIPLGSRSRWGIDQPLAPEEKLAALRRLTELLGPGAGDQSALDAPGQSAGEFALALAKRLRERR